MVLSAAGVINNAADLEVDTDNYFHRADIASLSTGNIDFTLAAWVKLESKSGSNMVIIGRIE